MEWYFIRSKSAWIKDTVIQVLYIVFALTVTLTIVYISINDQYTQYYESKLIEKTKKLSYNAAILLREKHKFINESEMEKIFNLAFSASSNKDAEIIKYALYTSDGQTVVASNIDSIQVNPIADAINCFKTYGNVVKYSDGNVTDLANSISEQSEKAESSYTYVHNSLILSYSPVIIEDDLQYVFLVITSYEPFILFGESVQSSLYSALFKGCLVMVLSYVIVSVRSNVLKPKDGDNSKISTNQHNKHDNTDKRKFYELLKIQMVPIAVGMVLGFPLLWIFFVGSGILKIVSLFFALSMLALSAVHILRVMYWLVLWYINKPISGYSSQVIQFCIFLSVFIAVFCYSVQNSYNLRIERSRLDGLRQSSIFAAMTLGNTADDNETLHNKAQNYQFDRKSQCIIIAKTQDGFQIVGGEAENIDVVQSLFNESWNNKTTVMGIRGEYIYGVTPVFNDNHETVLLGLRQKYSLYADELKHKTMDFILGMSVTVAAFIIFFIELNKLLEVLSIPRKKHERHDFKYATGNRSLVFFAVMCQHIPLFFFTLIVQRIYEHNPVTWLPLNLAKTLPLTIVLFVVNFGSKFVDKFYKVNQRMSIITGCIVSAGGFLLIAKVNHFVPYLLVLIATYTGISMVYNGLWDYTKYIARFGNKYPELSGVKKMTSGGDFIGSTVGAVFGAVAYDKFGLVAALLLSAVTLLCLSVLIRYMIPKPPQNGGWVGSGDEGKHSSLSKFLKSKNIIFYAATIIFPAAVVPYFINQFSPIYADSIQLSPSAVSWTSLLQALCIAYIAPSVAQWLSRRLVKSATVAAISNILAALGLFIFAAFPGIPSLYIASGIIGIGFGAGKTAVVEGYELSEGTASYKNKDAAYFSFTLIGRQIGTILFTVAHSLSSDGRFVLAIAVFVVICSILYTFNERKRGEKK